MEHLNVFFGSKKNPILFSSKEFKGKKLIDIRKQFFNKSGEITPTKKGISMNSMQMREFLNIIVENIEFIREYINIDELPQDIESVSIDQTTTIGRSFNIDFENDKKILRIDSKLFPKLEKNGVDVFKLLLLSLYESLFEVIEEDSDIELILDTFDKHVRKRI